MIVKKKFKGTLIVSASMLLQQLKVNYQLK